MNVHLPITHIQNSSPLAVIKPPCPILITSQFMPLLHTDFHQQGALNVSLMLRMSLANVVDLTVWMRMALSMNYPLRTMSSLYWWSVVISILPLYVRYRSPMDLQQVHPTPSSSATPFPSQSPFYFCHISDTPPFIPVPLVSPFIPMFPVSLISVSMTLWSSHLLHLVSSPHSCLSLFHASTFHS